MDLDGDKKRGSRVVGDNGVIEVDYDQEIGRGAFSAIVYCGVFDGRKVAVKRIDPDRSSFQDEVETLRKLVNQNIVRYLYKDKDDDFVYVVMERCACSLQDYLDGKAKAVGIKIDKLDIMRHISKGLEYLHSKSILHRDIHPSNVLMSTEDEQVFAKLSDFGVVKTLEGDLSISISDIRGTTSYICPEILRKENINKQSDVFSLGVVFHTILTKNQNPYGNNDLDIAVNIRDGQEPNLEAILNEHNGYAARLISTMLRDRKADRPAVTEVLAHYLFWGELTVLDFIQNASDLLQESSDSPCKEMRDVSEEIIGERSWKPVVCRSLDLAQVKVLEGDFKKYSTSGDVIGLLRQIRNWAHHFDSKSEKLKKIIGHTKEKMLVFMTSQFPLLLPKTHEVFKEYKARSNFSKFY